MSQATSVPLPFKLEFAFKVNCSNFASITEFEIWFHQSLSEKRLHPKREFFMVNPEIVRKIIAPFVEKEEIKIELETDIEEEASIEKVRRSKSPFNFDMIGLSAGHILSFTLDSKIKAIVVDSKNIRLLGNNEITEGELFSTSGLANKLLEGKFNHPQKAIQGTLFWKYNGIILNDI